MNTIRHLIRHLARIGILAIVATTVAFAQEKSDSNSDKEQIRQLQERVLELEKKLSAISTPVSGFDAADSISASIQTGLFNGGPASMLQPVLQQQQSPAGLRQSTSQGMNPNISVIGTFMGTRDGFSESERDINIGLDEAEFAFNAVVDPYARADFYIGAGKHSEPTILPEALHDEEEHAHEAGAMSFELEEAYVTLLHLPLSTQLKAGKFRTKFGKLNETHPHAYNFLDMPLMYQYFFSTHGFVDEGISVRWLLPNSAFFQELTLQILNGPAENFSFTRAEKNRLLYLAHLKNYFDLNDNTSLEVGLLGATGPNDVTDYRSNIFAADVTLKWKPLQKNRYSSFEWSSEFLMSKRNEAGGEISSVGWFSNMRYQFAKRWFLGGLAEYSEFPEIDTMNHKAYSGILQFYATEFQKFEIQGRYNDGNYFDSFFDVMLRAVFVIGAHGAHQY